MNEIDVLNGKLFRAAEHLYAAGMNLRGDFDDASFAFMMMAERMLNIIKIPEEKITEDEMKSILDEIIGAPNGNE